ncbi:AcrR family transcriptional regulator [Nakamurella sp. UYEF19]|uniref:TetR/AcrR family transcriptional regulator n=1 Tax=Nakamurella sp. UYEF19 TaxID=1756392 RepID=UPI0033960D96
MNSSSAGSATADQAVPARPVRKDVARNRALLLAAADEVFAARGVDITLDEVAREAGVGVATAYRHFDSKQVLLQALFENRIDQVTERMLRAESLPDPRQAFETFLSQACEMQANDRGMREVVHANHGLPAAAAFRERLEPIANRIVERAKDAGLLRPEFTAADIPMMLVTIGGVSDYAGSLEPGLWRRYLDFFLDGVLAEGVPRQRVAVPPLTGEQLDLAMDGWHRTRSRP